MSHGTGPPSSRAARSRPASRALGNYHSRAVEYQIDESKKTAALIWEFPGTFTVPDAWFRFPTDYGVYRSMRIAPPLVHAISN